MKFGAIKLENIFQDKRQVIVQITCLFWIFTKFFSYNLWHADRLYPLVPPFHFLDNVPNFIHLGLFWMAILGLSLIIFKPNKYLIFFTLVVEFCSCLLDQNRWQPYEYQFFITLLFLFCYRNNYKQFINYFSFLLAIIYLNSGLHKLSGAFLYNIWERIILHNFFGFKYETINNIFIHYSGLLLGFIEVFCAFGLLFFAKKKMVAMILIAMHIFVLLLLSPTGINYNSIVWPWNTSMILFLYIVFIQGNIIQISFPYLWKGFNKIHFFYLGILPLFCFFGWYDSFLSFNLYSGKSKKLEICIENEETALEYNSFFSKKGDNCKSQKSIKINNWSLREMNIITYPEDRVFLGIIKKFKERNPNIKASFYIYQYPSGPEDVKHYK